MTKADSGGTPKRAACFDFNRLRLENYAYFEEASRGVARRVRVVAFFRSAAAEAKEGALLVYIQQQLEYAKMWKLLEFSQVPSQIPNRADLNSLD